MERCPVFRWSIYLVGWIIKPVVKRLLKATDGDHSVESYFIFRLEQEHTFSC